MSELSLSPKTASYNPPASKSIKNIQFALSPKKQLLTKFADLRKRTISTQTYKVLNVIHKKPQIKIKDVVYTEIQDNHQAIESNLRFKDLQCKSKSKQSSKVKLFQQAIRGQREKSLKKIGLKKDCSKSKQNINSNIVIKANLEAYQNSSPRLIGNKVYSSKNKSDRFSNIKIEENFQINSNYINEVDSFVKLHKFYCDFR